MDEALYSRVFVLPYFLVHSKTSFVCLFTLIALSVYLTFKQPVKWKNTSGLVEYVVKGSIAIMFYSYFFMDYNYYFDSGFYIDRLFLLVFAILSWFYPWLLSIFIIQCIAISKQLSVPAIFNLSYTDISVLYQSTLLFWTFSLVKIYAKKWLGVILPYTHFYLIFIALLGTWYFNSGLGKMFISWVDTDNLYYLFLATHNLGWGHFLSESAVNTIAKTLQEHNGFLSFIVISLELLLPIIIFIQKGIHRLALLGFIAFHLAVFVGSGLFFWKWMLIEALAIYATYKYSSEFESLFNKSANIIYLCSFILYLTVFNGNGLYWINCGLTHNYKFFYKTEGQDASRLYSSYFSPYDLSFAQNEFYFLQDQPVFTGCFGSVDKSISSLGIDKLIGNPEGMTTALSELSRNSFDSNKKNSFERFLKKFTRTKVNDIKGIRSKLMAPMHIWQGPDQRMLKLESGKDEKLIISREDILILPDLRNEVLDKFEYNLKLE